MPSLLISGFCVLVFIDEHLADEQRRAAASHEI